MTTPGLPFRVVDPAAIPRRGNGRGPSRYAATVREFMISGARAIEIDLDGRDTHTTAGQLQKAINRLGLLSKAHAYERQGRVFIERLK